MSAHTLKQSGFTLVELVVVIIITGILSTFLVQFILLPVESYSKVAKRARMVDIANTVLQKITMDVRQALPNSVRVGDCNGGTANCIEFLRAPIGGRYRDYTDSGDALGPGADDHVDMLVPFSATESNEIIRDTDKSAACSNDLPVLMVINNTGNVGEDAWQMDNVAWVTSLDVGSGAPDDATESLRPAINFENPSNPGHKYVFQTGSSYQRFYLVDTPVKYIWDSSNNLVNRYRCYALDTSSTQDTIPTVTPDKLATQISNVTFSYQQGTVELPIGLLTISITVSEAGSPEKITLLQQIQIINMS